LGKCDKKTGRIIVSFTTFPARIQKVWIVVETILRQTLKPDKMILWLSKEEFPTLDSLPKKLLDQRKRGLEIVLVDENIRSHKKYYYVMKKYPEDYIISIDDDILYHSTQIQKLVDTERKNPRSICSFARVLPTYKDGVLNPYIDWDFSYKECTTKEKPISDNSRRKYYFLTGIGSIYPPHSLYEDILNIELALKLCPLEDDLWLNTMARLKGTKIVFVPGYGNYKQMYYPDNTRLWHVNGWPGLGQHSVQMEAVRKYYTEKLGIDPYKEE
jgi:hypothetical protein